jgi:hypothetical protein
MGQGVGDALEEQSVDNRQDTAPGNQTFRSRSVIYRTPRTPLGMHNTEFSGEAPSLALASSAASRCWAAVPLSTRWEALPRSEAR